MPENSLIEYNTEELKREAKKLRFEIDYQGRVLNERRAYLKRLEDELDRREIEAFWSLHPGLRLEVGDKLLVTDEFIEFDQKRGNPKWRYPAFVRNLEKSEDGYSIRIESDPNGKVSWTSGGIPLDIARRMREAWLAQESETIHSGSAGRE